MAEVKTTIEAHGPNLDQVIEDAAAQLDAYYGRVAWRIAVVEAEPAVEAIGERIPDLWRARVEAEAIQAGEITSRGSRTL